MSEAAELDECRDDVRGGQFPSRLRPGKSNGGGGGMEGVLKRLDAVESTVLEIKSQVDGITATLPQLAKKDDVTAVRVEVSDARGEIGKIAAIITYLATKADLSEEIGRVMGAIRASEIATIKWTIGIIIAVAGLAFTIGKYGH